MITQLIFVDPIVNEHASFAENIRSACFDLDQKQLQDNLGVKSWCVWVQEGPNNKQYSIQRIRIENREPSAFIQAFQNEVKQQNSCACRLNKVFQDHLSANHYLMNPVSKIKQVLDLAIDTNHSSKGYDFCHILPLPSDKIKEQKEYCQLAMNEKRESTIEAGKVLGMINMKKWIQKSPKENFILYDDLLVKPVEQSREDFLSFKKDPELLKGTQSLREQTGVSFEDLFPKASKITIVESV